MDTRTSKYWQSKPGSFDVCKTFYIDFEEDYPLINCQKLEFDTVVNCNDTKHYSPTSLISTYLDDYHLERYWNRLEHYIPRMAAAAGAMSPNYSMLIGMPDPMLRWQTYRSRFVGYIWQKAGVNVVPTICWSDKKCFSYCFEGVAKNSIVAVSSIGMTNDTQLPYFMDGYNAMIETLEPKEIIFMASKKYRHLFQATNIRWINSHFETRRQQIKNQTLNES
jgi:hypothetical protein